jgi:hypothetical protein
MRDIPPSNLKGGISRQDIKERRFLFKRLTLLAFPGQPVRNSLYPVLRRF